MHNTYTKYTTMYTNTYKHIHDIMKCITLHNHTQITHINYIQIHKHTHIDMNTYIYHNIAYIETHTHIYIYI